VYSLARGRLVREFLPPERRRFIVKTWRESHSGPRHSFSC
jgi:hypothetical protein